MFIVRGPDGTYAIHGITGIVRNRKVSAWYAADGALKDAESIDRSFTAQPIPHAWGKVRKALTRIGKRHVQST